MTTFEYDIGVKYILYPWPDGKDMKKDPYLVVHTNLLSGNRAFSILRTLIRQTRNFSAPFDVNMIIQMSTNPMGQYNELK